MTDKPMTILEHLDALRRTLIISIISVIPGAIVGWFIRENILQVLIRPVSKMHYKLVYIGATEALTAELMIALFAGIALASPVIAYQFWKFIMPALHANEKKYFIIFVPLSVVLFICGVVFGYFTVYTYGVQFLLSFGGDGLTPMLSLGKYLSFSMWFLLPFGLMFELPLIIVLLVRLGIITPKFLAAKRKWVVLASFIIAAIATPTTDMFTQSVMAAAIYVLYEISIWISYLVRAKVDKRLAAESTAENDGEELTGGEAVSGESGQTIDVDYHVENQAETGIEKVEPITEAASEPVLTTTDEDGGPKDGGEPDLEEIYQDIVERGNHDDQ